MTENQKLALIAAAAPNTVLRIHTDADAETIHFDGGERVFPCRCGETHRGDYAVNDWVRHNCFHDEPLSLLPEIEGIKQAICMQCGEGIRLGGDGAEMTKTMLERIGCLLVLSGLAALWMEHLEYISNGLPIAVVSILLGLHLIGRDHP